jgi:hypothetical protein
MTLLASAPPLKRIRVGIESTWYWVSLAVAAIYMSRVLLFPDTWRGGRAGREAQSALTRAARLVDERPMIRLCVQSVPAPPLSMVAASSSLSPGGRVFSPRRTDWAQRHRGHRRPRFDVYLNPPRSIPALLLNTSI